MKIGTMPEKQRYCLQPNIFNWKNIFIPLCACIAILTLGVGVALLFEKENPGVLSIAITVGLILSPIGFIMTRRIISPKKIIQINDDIITIFDGGDGRILAMSHFNKARIVYGYFLVPSRYATGYAPAIIVDIAGTPQLCIATNDLEYYYYWKGDDPWTKTYTQPKDLPYATNWVNGEDFMSIAKAIVKKILIKKTVGAQHI